MRNVEARLFKIAEEGDPRIAIAAAKLLDKRYPNQPMTDAQDSEDDDWDMTPWTAQDRKTEEPQEVRPNS